MFLFVRFQVPKKVHIKLKRLFWGECRRLFLRAAVFFLCVLDNNPALCLVSGAGYLAQSPHWDPLKHSKSFERPPPGMARSHIGSGTTLPCRRWIHTMGLLKVGTPLHWDDMLEHCSYIRRHGTLEAWLMAWGPGVRTWQMVKDRPHWDTKWHARLLTLDPPTQTWQ